MANSLSSYTGGPGDNSVTAAVAARFKEAYDDADNECRQAVAERNRLRKEILAAGIPLAAWDSFRKDSKKSGEVREREDVWRRRLLIWDLKPTGYQAAADFTTSDPGMADLNTVELARIDREGIAAGKGGHRRDSNNYTPGTEAFARWDAAWVRGDSEREEPQRKSAEPAGERRPRGRPRKVAAADRVPNEEARRVGKEDGLAGHMDHAARWAAGEDGHADYGLGHREGELERGDAAAAEQAEQEAPPAKRGRGRPPKDPSTPATPRRSRKAAEPGLLDPGEGAGETQH